MKSRLLILLTVFEILLSGCSSAAPETVRLPMGYIPNIQYAPFYVAVERGYFADEGISLEFDYSFETDGVALVGANELPFAVVSAEQVLLARAQGIPVVYVLGWFQDFPVTVVAREGSGVNTPADLAGKQIGLPGLFGASYIGLRALLNAGGVTEEQVTLNAIGFTQVDSFAAGSEDIIVGYETNEPIQLAAQGFAFTTLPVREYAKLPANGIITNETVIEENPNLVQAFVRALLRGLQDTIDDPDAAYEISKGYVENLAQADEAVQKEVLRLSIEYWKANPLGMIDPDAWENLQQVLLDMNLLTSPVHLGASYSDQFLP